MAIVQPTKWKNKRQTHVETKTKKNAPIDTWWRLPYWDFFVAVQKVDWFIRMLKTLQKRGKGKTVIVKKWEVWEGPKPLQFVAWWEFLRPSYVPTAVPSFVFCSCLFFCFCLMFCGLRNWLVPSTPPAGPRITTVVVSTPWVLRERNSPLPKRACVHVHCREIKRRRVDEKKLKEEEKPKESSQNLEILFYSVLNPT